MLGQLIAVGSRSLVYAWGSDAVAKVPLPSTPEGWIRFESAYAEAVFHCGASVPRALGLEIVDGREVAIFERIDGVSMWDALTRRESEAAAFGRDLGELHASLLAIVAPVTLPTQHARLTSKIFAASREVDVTLSRVLALLPDSAAGSLCHGDFHPKNIVIGARGLVVVDWFDACRGSPCGDVARTSLLLSPRRRTGTRPNHLPGASQHVLDELHDNYLTSVRSHVSFSDDDLERWMYIGAAARLAEGVEQEPLLSFLEGYR